MFRLDIPLESYPDGVRKLISTPVGQEDFQGIIFESQTDDLETAKEILESCGKEKIKTRLKLISDELRIRAEEPWEARFAIDWTRACSSVRRGLGLRRKAGKA